MSEGLPAEGERIGRFEVEGLLGRGGMGAVYKVRDPRTMMAYAAKVLDPDRSRERDFVKRFKTEAKIAARFQHMNLVHVFKLKGWSGTLFYIMELVDGRPLDEVLKESGRLPAGRALRMIRDASAGLAYVHGRCFVHRDIKPGNVLLRRDDTVKIADFGLAQRFGAAKRTKSGHVMGTAKYMAPELFEAGQVLGQTDVYALGCMTYEMIAGRPPFDSEDAHVLGDMHLYVKHKSLCEVMPEVDDKLSRFVDKMLEKDVSDRVSSAQAVHGWLDFYVTTGAFAEVPRGL